jgi:hypothetical protein
VWQTASKTVLSVQYGTLKAMFSVGTHKEQQDITLQWIYNRGKQ